jgi:hypothetical protein
MRLLPLLLLPCLLLVQSCWRGESADGLAVDLFLDQDSASVWDTLSGTIRLCNKWPNWTTVEYPNMQQAEVLFYDEQGELAFGWPLVRYPSISTLRLGPWCSKDFDFQFAIQNYRVVDTVRAGTYRAHARPADHGTPYTEKTIVLTD